MSGVIRVDKLSKEYEIGSSLPGYNTLRERIVEIAQKPFTRNGNGPPTANGSTIWALKDVSFEVKPGEVVGIVGRNGAGKSTLLKILSRVVEPTSGSATIYGRSASLLEVGTGFHPELTGRENIFLNGAILGMSRAEINARFDEIVEFAEIQQFLNMPVKRYSTGMYLRLAFAVAAHLRTEILFLDEVLAVGDVGFQRKCLGKVEGVAREGRTVVLVSHNLGAVTQLCKRVLWLDGGSLELDGNARDVVSAYCSRWVQASHTWQRESNRNGDDLKEALLLGVRLSQRGEDCNGVFSYDSPFDAEIEYELKKPIGDLRIVLRIVSDAGTIIFSTSDTDKRDLIADGLRTAGRYISTCNIPGNLLRPGKFFVTIGTARPGSWVELYEHLLMFEISAVGNPFPQRPGVISPVLDWDIQRLIVNSE